MTYRSYFEECLAKAADAEQSAAKFADGFHRSAWLQMAAGYRELALGQADNAAQAALGQRAFGSTGISNIALDVTAGYDDAGVSI